MLIGLKKMCDQETPTEIKPDPPLSVSCRGCTGAAVACTGAGALGAADLGVA